NNPRGRASPPGAPRPRGNQGLSMPPRPANRNPNPNRRRPAPLLPGSLMLMLIAMAVVVSLLIFPFTSAPQIQYSDFIGFVEKGEVKKVTFVGNTQLYGELKGEAKDNPDPKVKELHITNGAFSVLLP